MVSTLWDESFLQGGSIILMGMIKHSQTSQSNKFAISLQNLEKQVRDGDHVLHAYKHQSFY